MSARLGRFVIRHRTLGGLLHRVLHRGWHPHRSAQGGCLVCRAVWAHFERDHPEFMADIEQGLRDSAEGRWYHYDTKTGISTPNPDWPKDGPQPMAP